MRYQFWAAGAMFRIFGSHAASGVNRDSAHPSTYELYASIRHNFRTPVRSSGVDPCFIRQSRARALPAPLKISPERRQKAVRHIALECTPQMGVGGGMWEVLRGDRENSQPVAESGGGWNVAPSGRLPPYLLRGHGRRRRPDPGVRNLQRAISRRGKFGTLCTSRVLTLG